jgi:hypothetical protein
LWNGQGKGKPEEELLNVCYQTMPWLVKIFKYCLLLVLKHHGFSALPIITKGFFGDFARLVQI